MVYYGEHALVLQQSTDAGEEADEHDDTANCDEDVSLSVVCQRVVLFEDDVPAHLIVASHPDAQREDRAAC